MATAPGDKPFRAFRFYLVPDGSDDRLGLCTAKETVHGLELGRAHLAGRPTLFAELAEAGVEEITIVMFERRIGTPAREIVYRLGARRRHLAIDLDAMTNGIAYDRVLFPDAQLVRVRDV